MREAESILGSEEEVATIISIGVQATTELEDKNDQSYEYMRQMALNCYQTHEELRSRLHSTEIYFRWDAKLKFDAYMKTEELFQYIDAYTRDGVINTQVDRAIESLQSRPTGIKLTDISKIL